MCPHGSAIKLEHSLRQTGHSEVTPKISRAVLTWRKLLPETWDLKWCTQLQQGHFKEDRADIVVTSFRKEFYGRHFVELKGNDSITSPNSSEIGEKNKR